MDIKVGKLFHRQINQLIVLSIMDVIIIIYRLQKLAPSHRIINHGRDYYYLSFPKAGTFTSI